MTAFNVSVVIPTFNRVQTLARALDSVMTQTFKAQEILVVDDGSSDGTEQLVRGNYPSVLYLKQDNKGVSAARNMGIRHAANEWIAFLDSDDTWLPQKLKRQVEALTQSANHRVCHTEEIWIRNGKRVNQMVKHEKSGGWIYKKCLPLCAMSPSSIVIHRSVFDEVGLFDEQLPACEDYDLWLKICARMPVLYIEQPQIEKYGGHQDQLSRKYWGMDRFRIASLLKMLESSLLNAEDRKATREMLLDKIDVYLKGARKRDKQQEIVQYESLRQQVMAK